MKRNIILIAVASARIDMVSTKILVEKGHIVYATTRILEKNEGYGSLSAKEKVSIDKARWNFDVNVFDTAHLVQPVLPHMHQKNEGCITIHIVIHK